MDEYEGWWVDPARDQCFTGNGSGSGICDTTRSTFGNYEGAGWGGGYGAGDWSGNPNPGNWFGDGDCDVLCADGSGGTEFANVKEYITFRYKQADFKNND